MGTPAERASASRSSSRTPASTPASDGGDVVGERVGGHPHVAGEARPGGGAGGDGVGEALPELVDAVTGGDRRREDGGTRHAVTLHQPDEVRAALLHLGGGEPVGLVEDDDRHGLVGGERRDVVVVEPGVGVLLRVGDPDEEVDELEDALGLVAVRLLAGVEVGQVEQDEAVEGAELAGVLRGGVDEVAGADPEPVEQGSGGLGAPDGSRGRRGRRTAHADLRDLRADEGVEERGLAAAGGAGERDDGVATDEGGALGDLGDDGIGATPFLGGELLSPGGDRRREGVGGRGEALGGHDRTSCRAHPQRAHRTTARTRDAALDSLTAWSDGATEPARASS